MCSFFGGATSNDYWSLAYISSQQVFIICNTLSSDLGVLSVQEDGEVISLDYLDEPNHTIPENEEHFELERVNCLGVTPIPGQSTSLLLVFGTERSLEYAEVIQLKRDCHVPEVVEDVTIKLDSVDEHYLTLLERASQYLGSTIDTPSKQLSEYSNLLKLVREEEEKHYESYKALYSLLIDQATFFNETLFEKVTLQTESFPKLLQCVKVITMRSKMNKETIVKIHEGYCSNICCILKLIRYL